MLGRTVPCFDYLGYKAGFSPEKTWLFEDFDILTFYQVSESELNEKLGLFRSGRYKFEWEDIEFDMAEHNKLLRDTADEVKEIRSKQAKVQEEMIKAENESLAKWREDKEKNKVDESTVDALLAGEYNPGYNRTSIYLPSNTDPAISTIDAPVDANVWKVMVEEQAEIKPNDVVCIIEAMKLEINVCAPDDLKKAKIEKLLVQPGETVRAGQKLALVRHL